MRADQYLLLAKTLLQRSAITLPPGVIEFIAHDLVDDEIIAYGMAVVFLPQPIDGRAGMGGQPTELLSQLIANLGEQCLWQVLAVVIVERQQ